MGNTLKVIDIQRKTASVFCPEYEAMLCKRKRKIKEDRDCTISGAGAVIMGVGTVLLMILYSIATA